MFQALDLPAGPPTHEAAPPPGLPVAGGAGSEAAAEWPGPAGGPQRGRGFCSWLLQHLTWPALQVLAQDER